MSHKRTLAHSLCICVTHPHTPTPPPSLTHTSSLYHTGHTASSGSSLSCLLIIRLELLSCPLLSGGGGGVGGESGEGGQEPTLTLEITGQSDRS